MNEPPQTSDAMDHPAFASSAANLRSHIHKTVHFAMHISLGNISPILAPLAAEDAAARCIGWKRRDWVSRERELFPWFT